MGDGWVDTINADVIGTVLSATAFGRAWGPQLFLALLLVGLATMSGVWARRAALVISAVALANLGLIGHAAIDGGLVGYFHEASQVLHVLSSGFWLGALVPLLFSLRMFDHPAHEAGADVALRRFSGLGHLAVAILLLSGAANTWFILASTHIDLTAPYQRLLLIKICLAAGMGVLAIVNRYVFVPNIPDHGPGVRQLAHGTIAEIVLGAGILALVSVIGILSPAGG
jgi:putative copper resistance protein D